MALWNVYVGGFTTELVQGLTDSTTIPASGQYSEMTASGGIDRMTFDDTTGELRYLGNVAADLTSPQYIALHPSKPLLYAAEFAGSGRLSTFGIGPDGALERQSGIETPGTYAVAVSLHPAGMAASRSKRNSFSGADRATVNRRIRTRSAFLPEATA
jgi:6-phosphogluconolactonase (cycloisomerase 2 family)